MLVWYVKCAIYFFWITVEHSTYNFDCDVQPKCEVQTKNFESKMDLFGVISECMAVESEFLKTAQNYHNAYFQAKSHS